MIGSIGIKFANEKNSLKKKKTSDITGAKKAIAKRMKSRAAKKASIHVVSHKSKWMAILHS